MEINHAYISRIMLNEFLQDEEKINRFFMQTPVGVILFRGTDYVVDLANEKELEILGKQANEVVDKPIFEVFPELIEQGFKTTLDEVYRTGKPFTAREVPYYLSNLDATRFYNYILQPLRDVSGLTEGVIGVSTDVTELVTARNQLNENFQKYHALFESMKQGFCIIQMIFEGNTAVNYRFIEVNPAFEKQTGLVNAIGKTMKDFAPDMENFWFDIYGKVALTGEEVVFDAGASMLGRWYEVNAFRIGNPDELKVAVLFSDISERRMAEQGHQLFARELQQKVAERTRELERSNHELEQFAHVVSHDMKEPVRKIQTFISVINEHGGPDQTMSRYLGRIEQAASRLENMITGILQYSKADDVHQFHSVDLNELIYNITCDLELMIEEKKAQINIAPLPVIFGSEILLHQLFYNLLYNSLKFSCLHRSCIIEITATPAEMAGKEFVNITIKDNGIGFEPEMNEKIFGKFMRLNSKDKYEGTGLGLALCRKIVDRHSGFITASGKPDEGATFSVLLPK